MVDYKPQDDLHDPGQGHVDEHHAHATPLWILWAVFLALVFLTFLTVFFAHPFVKEQARIFVSENFYPMSAADASRFAFYLAMLFATTKGVLVVLFFMHLVWDRPFNAVVFLGTLFFVALFVGYTLADATQYRQHETATRTQMEPRYSAQQLRDAIQERLDELAEEEEEDDEEPEDAPDEPGEPEDAPDEPGEGEPEESPNDVEDAEREPDDDVEEEGDE